MNPPDEFELSLPRRCRPRVCTAGGDIDKLALAWVCDPCDGE